MIDENGVEFGRVWRGELKSGKCGGCWREPWKWKYKLYDWGRELPCKVQGADGWVVVEGGAPTDKNKLNYLRGWVR